MRQGSLLDDTQVALSGLIPTLRASLGLALGQDEEGRKRLVDRLNMLCAQAGIKLTAGNARSVSKDTVDKWVSPADRDHTPSVLAVVAVCMVTKNAEPLRLLARACGLDVITQDERDILEYAKAELEEEAARKRKHALRKRLNER